MFSVHGLSEKIIVIFIRQSWQQQNINKVGKKSEVKTEHSIITRVYLFTNKHYIVNFLVLIALAYIFATQNSWAKTRQWSLNGRT